MDLDLSRSSSTLCPYAVVYYMVFFCVFSSCPTSLGDSKTRGSPNQLAKYDRASFVDLQSAEACRSDRPIHISRAAPYSAFD